MGGKTQEKPADPKAKQQEQAAQPGVAPDKQVGATANTAVGQVIDYAADAGQGREGADADSYAIPFIIILQPLSPVVVEKLVPGAEAGMFMNSVTNELAKELFIIPCSFQRRWIRWGAREAGGGFKGEFTTPAAMEQRDKGIVKEFEGRFYYPETDGSINPKKSDRLSDTRSHYVLGMSAAESDIAWPGILALTSTGIKVSKNLMSRIEGIRLRKPDNSLFNPPSFSHMYRVTTTLEKNDKGTWFQPAINIVGPVTNAAHYAQAKAFHAQVTAGKVTAAYETANKGEGDGDSDSNTKGF